MAGIFTRNALNKIMEDENLTPQQRTEQVYALYGRALDDGYVSKSAAQQAQEAAVETAVRDARAEWEQGVTPPDIKGSDEYKALQGEFDAYRAMQGARTSADYKDVKPKFFETVYGMVDRAEGAKPLADQLAGIRESYEEYFTAPAPDPGKPPKPGIVLPSGGNPAPGAKLTLTEAMRKANAGETVDVSMIGK